MCPACVTAFLTSTTVIAGIASSTGGLAAVVIQKIRVKKIPAKENRDGEQYSGTTESESRAAFRVD
jgi:hypothetical protein